MRSITVEFDGEPYCSATPLVDLWAASRAAAALAEQGETKVFSTQVAPLGFDVTPDMVQGVWDTFVKPSQSDDAPPQSAEMRVLMAILRGVYMALAPAPDTTNTESEDEK